jgi:cytochrome P450
MRTLLNSEQHVDKAPTAVYHELLDEGVYVCSVATMYRILREHGEVRERRRQALEGGLPPPRTPAVVHTGRWTRTRIPLERQPSERSNPDPGAGPIDIDIDSVVTVASLRCRDGMPQLTAGHHIGRYHGELWKTGVAVATPSLDHWSRASGVQSMMKFASSSGLEASEPALVTGWDHCRRMLSGPELVSDSSLAGLAPEPTSNFLLMDGELHHAVRRLLISYLNRSRLDSVGERLEDTCRTLVRGLTGKSDVDLVADLAEPLALEGIMSVMEVPDARRQELGDLTRKMLGVLEPDLPSDARRRATGAALRATMLFERDGLTGNATGFHAALEEAACEGVIPVKLARSTPVVMLHGGYENPLNQLGCLIAWAVTNPDRFREAAVSAPAALFEEILRVFSPLRRVARWATSAVEGDGRPLQRGELVWVDLESANLDDRQFPTPGELDLTRKGGHLGFGYGRHLCPGAALARLEGQVLIRSLLSIPADQFREFIVEWQDGFVGRGPMKIVRE